ncbi:MAG TPA: UdgX family uracil-DNA binding protein [Casimicrobiaceae bacterium]|jgi:DNA polymerase
MVKRSPGDSNQDDPATLSGLAQAINDCRRCDLWKNATQGVPGEGAAHARIMLVGEQPGDQEDLAGRPFVGPAGKLLDKALAEAGVDRRQVYVTNVVKHFSWFPRGKRRMHKTPTQQEVAACLDWLRHELRMVQPRIIVCLGATAAKALLGPSVRVTVDRGRWLKSDLAEHVMVTVHPSSILRVPREDFDQAFAALVEDLGFLSRAG